MKNLRTKISEILKGTNRELKCPYCPYELMGGSIAPHTMKVHPDKFISRVDQLLSLFQKEVEGIIEELGKTVTQQGIDPEHRLNPDENDIKREMHNKGRAYGYTEALGNLRQKLAELKKG